MLNETPPAFESIALASMRTEPALLKVKSAEAMPLPSVKRGLAGPDTPPGELITRKSIGYCAIGSPESVKRTWSRSVSPTSTVGALVPTGRRSGGCVDWAVAGMASSAKERARSDCGRSPFGLRRKDGRRGDSVCMASPWAVPAPAIAGERGSFGPFVRAISRGV